MDVFMLKPLYEFIYKVSQIISVKQRETKPPIGNFFWDTMYFKLREMYSGNLDFFIILMNVGEEDTQNPKI